MILTKSPPPPLGQALHPIRVWRLIINQIIQILTEMRKVNEIIENNILKNTLKSKNVA